MYKLRSSNQFLEHNASTILSIMGVVGVIGTSIMVANATLKVKFILEKKEEEKGDKLNNMEVFKCASTIYFPSILVGLSTVTCILGANTLSRHEQASLVSAYSLIDNSYKEYKNKLKELYGDEAHAVIVDSIAIEKSTDIYVYSECLCANCNLSLEDRSSNKKLFYDEYAKRYFESTIEQVILAEYHINRNYVIGGIVSLNDLYEFLGLELTDYGSTVGWTNEDEVYWIDFNHRKIVLSDGRECYILEMPFGPSVHYEVN